MQWSTASCASSPPGPPRPRKPRCLMSFTAFARRVSPAVPPMVARRSAGGDGRRLGRRPGAAVVRRKPACISRPSSMDLSPMPPVSDAARQEARETLKAIGPAGTPHDAGRGRSDDGRAIASDRQPTRRAPHGKSGAAAGAAWRPGRPHRGAPGKVAVPRGPARPAARTPARSNRPPVRHKVARGRRLAEVQALLGLELDPALPAMRAHGVPELAAYLGGKSRSRRPHGA